MTIQFKAPPELGLSNATPMGHYLMLLGDKAEVVSVGKYLGRRAYADALPGFDVTLVEVMACESPDMDGQFFKIHLSYSVKTAG